MDSVAIYQALLAAAENFGFVGDYAEQLLDDAANAIADDPRNAE